MRLASLPDEVWLQILQYLEQQDLITCMRWNRTTKRLVHAASLNDQLLRGPAEAVKRYHGCIERYHLGIDKLLHHRRKDGQYISWLSVRKPPAVPVPTKSLEHHPAAADWLTFPPVDSIVLQDWHGEKSEVVSHGGGVVTLLDFAKALREFMVKHYFNSYAPPNWELWFDCQVSPHPDGVITVYRSRIGPIEEPKGWKGHGEASIVNEV